MKPPEHEPRQTEREQEHQTRLEEKILSGRALESGGEGGRGEEGGRDEDEGGEEGETKVVASPSIQKLCKKALGLEFTRPPRDSFGSSDKEHPKPPPDAATIAKEEKLKEMCRS